MLHALVEFANREGIAAEPGFKTKAIRWQLVFTSDGRFVTVVDMSTGEGKQRRPREVDRCPDLSPGEMVSGGNGCRPFLVDGLDVVVQLGREKVDEGKLDFFDAKHAYWVELLRHASVVVPELKAIADTFSDPVQLLEIRQQLMDGKAKSTELATLAISHSSADVPYFLVQSEGWHGWWRSFRAGLAAAREAPKSGPSTASKSTSKKAGRKKADASLDSPAAATATASDPSRMLCLLSGDWTVPQPTHPKISGLASVGGHSAGDALSSFDKDAFCSYGLEQGANAAISPQMAAVYAASLNKLLRDDHHSVSIAGAKVVYWFNQSIPPELDPIQELRLGAFSSGDEEEEESSSGIATEKIDERTRRQAESSVRKLFEAFRLGEQSELANATFYSLSLSGNAGRIVVRDLQEGRFENLVTNVYDWFRDLEIVSRFGDKTIGAFKFNAVLGAPYRDLKDATAPMAAALWRAAIRRDLIPAQAAAATLRRTTIDVIQGESPRHARYGLLRAYINRLFRSTGVPDMTSELKPVADDLQEHPAYICGQVMGVLAKIQKQALPNVKAGVIERFYAAAMSTPLLVLGRLVRTAEVAHIPQIRSHSPGLAGYFQSMLTDAWTRLRAKPPTSLTLEQQTLFAIGYYHQLAVRKAKLKDGSTIDVDAADDAAAAQS